MSAAGRSRTLAHLVDRQVAGLRQVAGRLHAPGGDPRVRTDSRGSGEAAREMTHAEVRAARELRQGQRLLEVAFELGEDLADAGRRSGSELSATQLEQNERALAL